MGSVQESRGAPYREAPVHVVPGTLSVRRIVAAFLCAIPGVFLGAWIVRQHSGRCMSWSYNLVLAALLTAWRLRKERWPERPRGEYRWTWWDDHGPAVMALAMLLSLFLLGGALGGSVAWWLLRAPHSPMARRCG